MYNIRIILFVCFAQLYLQNLLVAATTPAKAVDYCRSGSITSIKILPSKPVINNLSKHLESEYSSPSATYVTVSIKPDPGRVIWQCDYVLKDKQGKTYPCIAIKNAGTNQTFDAAKWFTTTKNKFCTLLFKIDKSAVNKILYLHFNLSPTVVPDRPLHFKKPKAAIPAPPKPAPVKHQQKPSKNKQTPKGSKPEKSAPPAVTPATSGTNSKYYEIKSIGGWKESDLSKKAWITMDYPVPGKYVNEIKGIRVVYKGGTVPVFVKSVTFIVDGKTIAKDEHKACVNKGKLTQDYIFFNNPGNLSPNKAVISFKVRSGGKIPNDSVADIILLSDTKIQDTDEGTKNTEKTDSTEKTSKKKSDSNKKSGGKKKSGSKKKRKKQANQ